MKSVFQPHNAASLNADHLRTPLSEGTCLADSATPDCFLNSELSFDWSAI